jgi:protein-L-isoaspartate(D-aspartate) O-methyltransferase
VTSVREFRDFYAQFVVASAGCANDRLTSAFSRVPREAYVGAGPWQVFAGNRYLQTVSDDPRLVYQDILIGLAPERGINNGQPSLHALCLAVCAPERGDSVVHIGAGTGYYTAIVADLVGSTGRVTAFECEVDLAEKARMNLRHLDNVSVVAKQAAHVTLPKADVIYVNAGATHPVPAWLDALDVGGRLIFPLTSNGGWGCMLLVTRRTADVYEARGISRAAFIPCVGARNDDDARALADALEGSSFRKVRTLHRNDAPGATAWCVGAGWWLSTAELPA